MPHFISKPSPTITVKETQNVLIPCKANGFPQPVITWYKNGHLIEKERKYFGERSLNLKKIQFQDRTNQMANVKRVIWVIVKVVGRYGVKNHTNKLINHLE